MITELSLIYKGALFWPKILGPEGLLASSLDSILYAQFEDLLQISIYLCKIINLSNILLKW